jgi:hypothetical protein
VAELALTGILPVLPAAFPWSRYSPAGITVAAASTPMGLALNRLEVGIFGYFTKPAWFISLL